MKFETPLCEMAFRYGTDKCPQINHSYTPFYYNLLKDKRESFRKVLELGIGCPSVINKHGNTQYRTGASLYMWRDFFPQTMIYGADILPEAIFVDDWIKTFQCDETQEKDLLSLLGYTGVDIDLFIDDGSHKYSDQVFVCQTLMPLLKEDVIYIIEDARYDRRIPKLLPEYNCTVHNFAAPGRRTDCLIVVERK